MNKYKVTFHFDKKDMKKLKKILRKKRWQRMNKKHIFDINYDEWLTYYNTKCDLECNNKKYCPFKVGACCLGDILSKDDKRALNDILNDIDGTMIEVL